MTTQVKGVIIKPSEHVFIAGRNGSGKSFLAEHYLANYQNVIVLDTKGMIDWPQVPKEEKTVITHLSQIDKVRTNKIIYKPAINEMTLEYYDLFFKFAYFRRNTIVWVDEAMSVSPNPSVIPFWYKAILTRGRQLNVAVWSLSQRPSGISQLPISEAIHVFSFDLNMPQDREKLAKTTGCIEFMEKPGQYKFWYFDTRKDKAILAQLKVK